MCSELGGCGLQNCAGHVSCLKPAAIRHYHDQQGECSIDLGPQSHAFLVFKHPPARGKYQRRFVWDSPEITDTFLNANRARRVKNGNYPKKVWSRVQARRVRQALQPGNAVATVVQNLGVHESVLRRWLKELGSAGNASERPLKNEHSHEQLKRELARVKMERDIIKKALLRERPIVKYGFIARYRTVWPVRMMCRVMTVSASGYYD